MHLQKFLIFILCIFLSPAFAGQNEYTTSIINTALHNTPDDPLPLKTLQGAHVQMVTFTNYSGYKITDLKLGATVWVTAENELKNKCMQFVKQHPGVSHQELTLWIAELLGLPSDGAATRRFVVLDVPVIQAYYGTPKNTIGVFRPCTDPRVGPHTDGSPICPATMNAADNNIASDYKTWFINNSIAAYTLKTGAPWTERGYTYNWNRNAKNIFGVSEFVVLKDTPVLVMANPYDSRTAYVTAEEYCGAK